MDTRNKILTTAQALSLIQGLRAEGREVSITTGYFDPLTPSHVRRLQRLGSRSCHLVVIVTDPPDPILPLRARAELAAAVAAAGTVVPVGVEELEAFLSRLPFPPLERGEDEDLTIRQELIRHVHCRQQAK